MVRDVFFDIVVNLLLGPAAETPFHFLSDRWVDFVVNFGLQGVHLTADFGGFGLATNLRLVFVGEFVVNTVVEVQIVKLLILPIDLPHLLTKLNCTSILQKRLYVI